LTNGKFTAQKGTYTITVTATDESDNETVLTKQITVDDETINPNPNPNENEEKDGLSAGAIAGIVCGSVVIVGAAGFAVFMVLKKKKMNKKED
jgi:hypothetical protein